MENLNNEELLAIIDRNRDTEIYNLVKDEQLDGKTFISLKESHIKTLYDYKVKLAIVQFNILLHDLKQKFDTKEKALIEIDLNNQPNESKSSSGLRLHDQPNLNSIESGRNFNWPENFKFPSHRLTLVMREMLCDPREELSNFAINNIVNALFDELWSMNISYPTSQQLFQACKSATDEYPSLLNCKFDIKMRKLPDTIGIIDYIKHKLKNKFQNKRSKLDIKLTNRSEVLSLTKETVKDSFEQQVESMEEIQCDCLKMI